MNIDDFEIKIKKFDREKNYVIVHLTILSTFEIRGFLVRYTTTKYSNGRAVWIVSPPSQKMGKVYFHIARCKDLDLWKELEKRIIEKAVEYTDNI
jgi:hypothetical protein